MKFSSFRLLFLFFLISVNLTVFANGFRFNREDLTVQDTISFVSPFMEDNERCFKCHGQDRYEYLNLLSLLIFFSVVGIIAVHILFRISKINKTNLKIN